MIDEVLLRPAEPSDANELFRLASILATSATPRRANARYFAVASRRAGDFYRAIGYQESAAYFKKSFER